MKIKTNYQDEEFKARQGSFGFFCAWAHKFVLNFRKECRAGWYKLHQGMREIQQSEQLAICFKTVKTLTEWATWTPSKNHELELKPIDKETKAWEEEFPGIHVTCESMADFMRITIKNDPNLARRVKERRKMSKKNSLNC